MPAIVRLWVISFALHMDRIQPKPAQMWAVSNTYKLEGQKSESRNIYIS